MGATACGKSKLAIEIAHRFGGEIISADSMQIYNGLDIVTNKVTLEEQSQARHHMINLLDPIHRYSVVDFREKSLGIISSLFDKSKLPIVVGGTNYYIESLLWKSFTLSNLQETGKRNIKGDLVNNSKYETLMDSEAELVRRLPEGSLHTNEDLEDMEKFFAKPIYAEGFKQIDSEKLWNLLEKVDPKAAHTYHPHDKRRIIRCLQVIQKDKQNYSNILESLNRSGDSQAQSLGGPLRFDKTCVLWLSCDTDVLDRILDERVDQMLERGLLEELENFHNQYNGQRLVEGAEPNYDKGIFQTIGFKEFHNYLILDRATKESSEGKLVLKKSIDAMKFSTRKYAKRQLKWIRRRFLQSGTRDLPAIFKLETAFDDEAWKKQVREPAFEIIEGFITDKPLSENSLQLKKEPEVQPIINQPAKYYCEQCDRTFIGSHNIETHLKSRTHERRVASNNKTSDHMSKCRKIS